MISVQDEQDVMLAVTSCPRLLRLCMGTEMFGLLDDNSLFLIFDVESISGVSKGLGGRFLVVSRYIDAVDGVYFHLWRALFVGTLMIFEQCHERRWVGHWRTFIIRLYSPPFMAPSQA